MPRSPSTGRSGLCLPSKQTEHSASRQLDVAIRSLALHLSKLKRRKVALTKVHELAAHKNVAIWTFAEAGCRTAEHRGGRTIEADSLVARPGGDQRAPEPSTGGGLLQQPRRFWTFGRPGLTCVRPLLQWVGDISRVDVEQNDIGGCLPLPEKHGAFRNWPKFARHAPAAAAKKLRGADHPGRGTVGNDVQSPRMLEARRRRRLSAPGFHVMSTVLSAPVFLLPVACSVPSYRFTQSDPANLVARVVKRTGVQHSPIPIGTEAEK
jgi:hypothetical protein